MKRERGKKLLTIVSVTAVFIAIFFSIRFFNSIKYEKRITITRLHLMKIRSILDEFREREGRYPDTLAELGKYSEKTDLANTSEDGETFSCKDGNNDESSVLNGNGGWYYNKETGEIKINLTLPLKEYLSYYFGKDRNEVPSEW